MRRSWAFVGACAFLLVASVQSGTADEGNKQVKDAKPFLTVRLVDEQGKPVADARAGNRIIVKDFDGTKADDWNFRDGGKVDANGIVRFREGADVFKDFPVVITSHAHQRTIGGIKNIAGVDRTGVVEITLLPGCHVQWHFTSTEAKEHGHDVGRLNVITNFEGSICSFSIVTNGKFHARLPSCRFTQSCHGDIVDAVSKDIETKTGQRPLAPGTTDLEVKQHILLEGKPAPEIEEIIEWKNGPPLALARLHGTFVLLECRGWWCGRCLERGIPDLLKLQDPFSKNDLAIVGIHTPYYESEKIESVAEHGTIPSGQRGRRRETEETHRR
jgi:hypothetical protein